MKPYNFDIDILMEIKVNSTGAQIIIQSLKMPNYIGIPSEGFLEGFGYCENMQLVSNWRLSPKVIDLYIDINKII